MASHKGLTGRAGSVAIGLWLPAGIVAAWWFLSRGSESLYFPSLSRILARFRDLWLFAEVPSTLMPSLYNFAIGFGCAVVGGLVLGLAFGLMPRLYETFLFAIEIARATPVLALLPLAIILLGIGVVEKATLIALISVWPILLNTTDGIRNIEPLTMETAQSYRLTRTTRLLFVTLPAASPQMLAGIRVAVSYGVGMMVTSEFYAASTGIGYFVLRAQDSSAIVDVWTAVILLGILGYVFNVCVAGLEYLMLGWHRGAKGLKH